MTNCSITAVLIQLRSGPKSTRELGVSTDFARFMLFTGFCLIDPDMFPEEYVPFNPMILRLLGNGGRWEGWKHWNI